MTQLPEDIKYDPQADVLTIDGIRYARAFFRALATGEIGGTFKIIAREDGMVTLQRINDAPERPG